MPLCSLSARRRQDAFVTPAHRFVDLVLVPDDPVFRFQRRKHGVVRRIQGVQIILELGGTEIVAGLVVLSDAHVLLVFRQGVFQRALRVGVTEIGCVHLVQRRRYGLREIQFRRFEIRFGNLDVPADGVPLQEREADAHRTREQGQVKDLA